MTNFRGIASKLFLYVFRLCETLAVAFWAYETIYYIILQPLWHCAFPVPFLLPGGEDGSGEMQCLLLEHDAGGGYGLPPGA